MTQGPPVNDKEMKHLQKELEYTKGEVERLKRELMFKEQGPIGDPADKEEIDRLRKEIDKLREDVHKARREKKIEYVEKIVEKITEPEPTTPPYVFVDKALEIAEKNFHNRLVPYIYTCWKLMFHLRIINDEYRKVKAEGWKQSNAQSLVIEPPNVNAEIKNYISTMAEILVFCRTSLVEIIFELFVRSSNHAHSKKVNSLILFSINLNESKEVQYTVWSPFVRLYFMYPDLFSLNLRLREAVHANSPDNEFLNTKLTSTSMKNMKKTRNADLEFRDTGNSWVESTLESIENKKRIERNEPNMVLLIFLKNFSLLSICSDSLQ